MPTMNTIPDLPVSSHLCILGIYSADCDGERGMVLNETDLFVAYMEFVLPCRKIEAARHANETSLKRMRNICDGDFSFGIDQILY